MIDEERKFLDGLFKYGESCGLDRKETYRVISKVAQNSEPQESDRWKKGKHPLMVCDSEISEETEKRYFEFHEHLVNEILGFINENPEILEVYKKETAPVAKYYAKTGALFSTVLSQSVNRMKDEVAKDVIEYLREEK